MRHSASMSYGGGDDSDGDACGRFTNMVQLYSQHR